MLSFDRTLIQIRERSFLDLLDLALVIVREKPKPLAAAAIAGCAPFALFNAWLAAENSLSFFVYVGLLLMEIPWATAPLTLMLGGLMFGERPPTRRIVRDFVRSLVPMFLFHVLLRGLIIVIVVLTPILPSRLAFLNEVILLERGKWRTFYRRAGALCGERGSELFGRFLVEVMFGLLFVFSFWACLAAARSVLLAEWDWEEIASTTVYSASVQLAVWLAVCFFTLVRFLAYIDQRIRLEGWEVELRLRHVGRVLEDSDR